MKYTVRYYDRNPLDPQARFDIQRGIVEAGTPEEATSIMELCDVEIIDVDIFAEPAQVTEAETQAAESAEIADWLTPERANEIILGMFEILRHQPPYVTEQPEYAEARRVAENFNFDEVEERPF